ncbi:hypothetical protein TSUD_237310 [Trifolium subterraneum]|uniref:Uncharacterized protein n=1 Tax=Trifolium subterraneum TaxID=3900 RepID=A0A2Z6NYK0_TRISU|nr:hypothetical protein TSUD_237310 [Trifolium subterraneum]
MLLIRGFSSLFLILLLNGMMRKCRIWFPLSRLMLMLVLMVRYSRKCNNDKKNFVDKVKKTNKMKNKKNDASDLNGEKISAENGDKNVASENGGRAIFL